jgi:GTPase involved in cell partitioning and DNA repair
MSDKKNWDKVLKDIPTDILLSEIENRKTNFDSLDELSIEIMNKIDYAIEQFGKYTFDDKGSHEVMDISKIVSKLSKKSIEETANILSEILDNYKDEKRSKRVVDDIIGEFDNLPEEDFDRLLNSDERFEY